MTTSMTMRAIAYTSIWSAVLAPLCVVFINLLVAGKFDLSPVPTYAMVGAAFGVWTTFAMELLPALFEGRRPWLGIIWFTILGVASYAGISLALGSWLFATDMQDGLSRAVFFSAFMAVTIFFVVPARSENPAAMFSGMCAGFLFQPVVSALGLASAADPQQSLYGCIGAYVLFAIYQVTTKSIYDSAYKR